jgi:hypothetical protein
MTAHPASLAGGYIRQQFEHQSLVPTNQGGVYARFFEAFPLNEQKSKKAGCKIYDKEVHVKILIAGDKTMAPVRRITDANGEIVGQEYIDRYPDAWAAFKKGEEAPISGTPLESWPGCDKAVALSLKSLHIHTVQDLAGVGDGVLDKLPLGGRDLRTRAKTFLASAETGATALQLAESQAREAATAQKLTDLQAQIDRLTAGAPLASAAPVDAAPIAPLGAVAVSDADIERMMEQAENPRRPGRPRKAS